MLSSIALIILSGVIISAIFTKCKLPSLLGMLLLGIALGPELLNLIDGRILAISSELRQVALIIILLRVGLALNIGELKGVGRSAMLMCWLPACFEIAGVVFMATYLLDVTPIEAAIMGCVLAAVSPAVIVPRMLKLISTNYGTKKGIPQMIMAAASLDDIFVIVLFSSLITLATESSTSFSSFIQLPIALFLGAGVGVSLGSILVWWFKKFLTSNVLKVIVLLSLSFLLLGFETLDKLSFSALISIVSMGVIILKYQPSIAKELAKKFAKLWIVAEILLFVLIGAALDLQYALVASSTIILVVILGLVLRSLGVYICLLKSSLNWNERLFCGISYLPKATVQAAIGAIPLSLGLECGQLVLTVAVVSILLTAPLGALAIDLSYKKLLSNK